MATLYELTGQYQMLLALMEDPDTDPQIIEDSLEAISGEIEVKADGYAKVWLELMAIEAALGAEIDRLTAKKRAVRNNIDRMMESLKNGLIAAGKPKFKTDLFSFSVQKNPPKVIIDDPDLIPKYYLIQVEPRIDTAAIKDLLKNGDPNHELDGAAHLEQGESLRIR